VLERDVMDAMQAVLDEELVKQALEYAVADLRERMEAAQPTQLEADLRRLEMRIERALDLAIEIGDMDGEAILAPETLPAAGRTVRPGV